MYEYHSYLAFSLDDFFKGVSKPINKKLFSIFKTCGFGEESGHGVPTVIRQYGKQAYYIANNHINVVIPFDDDLMVEVDKKNTPEITLEITPETTKEKILKLIKSNERLSKKDIAKILKIKEDSAKYFLTKLKKEGIIEHIGSTKNGYWDIKELNYFDVNSNKNINENVSKNDTNIVTVMSQKDHSNVTVMSQKNLNKIIIKLQKNGYILNRQELDILCLIY